MQVNFLSMHPFGTAWNALLTVAALQEMGTSPSLEKKNNLAAAGRSP